MRAPDNKRALIDMSWSWLGLEVGILGANVAAFAGMARLFTSFTPMATILVAVLLTHGVCVSCRWARLPMPVAAVISSLAVGLSSVSAAFPQTIRYVVIPTGATWFEIQRVSYEAWNTFITTRAPTEPLVGFTLAAVAGAWLVAVVSDTIAFRLGFLIEAIVPPGVVMVLVAALAPTRYRLEAVLAFAISVALVVTSARVRELSREAWLGQRPRRAGAFGAAVFIATSLGIAGFVATHPPTWANDGIIDLQGETAERGVRDRSPGQPLVSTRARLVEQSDVAMFTVKWPASPAYWKQTTLDLLQNETWTSSDISLTTPSSVAAGIEVQTAAIEIKALRSAWLPVPDGTESIAQDVGGIVGPAAGIRLDSVGGGYSVRSMKKSADYLVQTRAQANPVGIVTDRHLETSGVSPRVVELAKSITATASNDRERAELLQQFLLSNFTYDLEIAQRSSLGLETFLFTERRGYCEQFSSSFATMARTLGIPSRVAVGFVRGNYSGGVGGAEGPETAGTWEVRGRDAHAWPEVFLDNKWIRFEVTPGRGDTSDATVSTTIPPTTNPPVTTAFAVPTTAAAGVQPVAPTPTAPAKSKTPFAALLAGLAVLALPSLVRKFRSGRNIAADAGEVPLAVSRAMTGLEDDLAWIGCPRPPGTPLTTYIEGIETSHAKGSESGELPWMPQLNIVVERVEQLRYSGGVVTDSGIMTLVSEAKRAVRSATPLRWRVRRLLSINPRPKVAK